jgi:hypothetical protein
MLNQSVHPAQGTYFPCFALEKTVYRRFDSGGDELPFPFLEFPQKLIIAQKLREVADFIGPERLLILATLDIVPHAFKRETSLRHAYHTRLVPDRIFDFTFFRHRSLLGEGTLKTYTTV